MKIKPISPTGSVTDKAVFQTSRRRNTFPQPRIDLELQDVCPPDYVLDASGVLYGIPVDRDSTWMDVKINLLCELDSDDSLAEADWKEGKVAVERWFARKGETNYLMETLCAPQITSDDGESDIQMWFRLKGATRNG